MSNLNVIDFDDVLNLINDDDNTVFDIINNNEYDPTSIYPIITNEDIDELFYYQPETANDNAQEAAEDEFLLNGDCSKLIQTNSEMDEDEFLLNGDCSKLIHNVEMVPYLDPFDIDSFFNDIILTTEEPKKRPASPLIVQESKKVKLQTGGGGKSKPDKVYKIIKRTEIDKNEKFKYTEVNNLLEIDVKENRTFAQATAEIYQLFEQIHTDFIKPLKLVDFAKVVISHPLIKFDVWTPFMEASSLTPKIIFDKLDKIVQSYKLDNEEIYSKNHFNVRVSVKETLTGGAYVKKGYPKTRPAKVQNVINNMIDFLNDGGHVKVVYNTDDDLKLCLIRAVVIARAYIEMSPTDAANLCAGKNQLSPRFAKKVMELCLETGIRKGPCGPREIKIIETYLKDYQIVVFRGNYKHKEYVYLNESREFKKHIYLCLHNDHYYVISRMTSHINRSYFCKQCQIGVNNLGKHNCAATCSLCQRFDCDLVEKYVCPKCKKTCKNESCLNRHVEKVCESVTICIECGEKKLRKHVCGFDNKWCKNCNKSVNMNHRCFIQTEDQKNSKKKIKESKFDGFVFFDYECFASENDGKHVPNLIIASVFCNKCKSYNEKCEECSKPITFNTNDEFCQWLLTKENYIAIAHNMRAYDGIFIAHYCTNNQLPTDALPNMIATPTKLLSIMFRKLKVIDSYSFLAMPLDQFPKTFNLEELKKGFYAHKFNTPENANYVGKFPSEEYFGTEFFSIKKYDEFKVFYEKNKDRTDYDNKKELYEYCLSDVKILEQGCLKFRDIIMQQTKRDANDTGIDPFRTSITIASLCNLIYRRNFMPENSIGIIPDTGYAPNILSSNKCEKWLQYLSNKEKINIQCKNNGGEKKIGKYYLDGFCLENKTFYEFSGCYYHGCNLPDCPRKLSYTTWNPTKQSTMGYLNYLTQKKNANLRRLLPDFKFIEIWECVFDRMSEEDVDFKDFLANNKIKVPIVPRDVLKGGRTNAFILYYLCKINEKIKYLDITSLYPTVQKKEEFPIGHPEILTQNLIYILGLFFGIAKLTLLAPADLDIPVLPVTINGKLLFALCFACAEQQSQTPCKHKGSERQITGTWCTPEIDYAISKGYKVVSVDEIWHWSKKGDLFSKYVNSCVKEKQENSDWPVECTTDEAKDKYIQNYFKREDILLDKDKIKKNSGARQVAKIKCNSMWGFLAMNNNKTKHKFVNTERELYEMLANKQYEITNIIPSANGKMMQVYYSENEDLHVGCLKTNVILAAFVTCFGRLRLYQSMEKLGDRLLYVDTDSVFFISRDGEYEKWLSSNGKNGEWEPETGPFLGDFTNELEANTHIVEFVSGGPKNYSYRTSDGKTKSCCKGITLHRVAGLEVNFESMKKIVTEDQTRKISVPQQKFIRSNKDWTVKVKEEQKDYGFVYTKRAKTDNYRTRPFGYKI